MNDKKQLAAMGEHLAEQQPLRMAKRIDELEGQARVMVDLLRDLHEYIGTSIPQTVSDYYRGCDLLERIDAALAGTLPDRHPDDAAVDRFSVAMKAKLAAAREKGRGGWDDPDACTVEFLADLLAGHVGKGNQGNFEDIANLAMMLHQRGADPAVLAGKVPVPVVPEGWKLVPLVPTEGVCEAGVTTTVGDRQSEASWIGSIYSNMLAAAPSLDGTK